MNYHLPGEPRPGLVWYEKDLNSSLDGRILALEACYATDNSGPWLPLLCQARFYVVIIF